MYKHKKYKGYKRFDIKEFFVGLGLVGLAVGMGFGIRGCQKSVDGRGELQANLDEIKEDDNIVLYNNDGTMVEYILSNIDYKADLQIDDYGKYDIIEVNIGNDTGTVAGYTEQKYKFYDGYALSKHNWVCDWMKNSEHGVLGESAKKMTEDEYIKFGAVIALMTDDTSELSNIGQHAAIKMENGYEKLGEQLNYNVDLEDFSLIQ